MGAGQETNHIIERNRTLQEKLLLTLKMLQKIGTKYFWQKIYWITLNKDTRVQQVQQSVRLKLTKTSM